MKFAVVTTTIHIPNLLDGYASNFRKFGWKDIFFVIAGDKKTPPEIASFCSELEKKYSYDVFYLDIEQQKALDEGLFNFVPFNCIQRRNFAMLFAYKRGADIIMTIDDDNYVTDGDCLKANSVVGSMAEFVSVKSDTGWYNVCETLEEEKNRHFFHRGYPVDQRKAAKHASSKTKAKVVVNAGLWLDAPDTDAISWLNFGEINARRFKDEVFGKNFTLEKGVWCPFNSQNTALSRDALPAYFLNPAQRRYDDIWASFILRKVADHLGHAVSYGYPIVTQKRNVHNYFRDLKDELDGMERTPDLIAELRSIQLDGRTYHDCTVELIDKLSDKFKDLKEGYDVWLKALKG